LHAAEVARKEAAEKARVDAEQAETVRLAKAAAEKAAEEAKAEAEKAEAGKVTRAEEEKAAETAGAEGAKNAGHEDIGTSEVRKMRSEVEQGSDPKGAEKAAGKAPAPADGSGPARPLPRPLGPTPADGSRPPLPIIPPRPTDSSEGGERGVKRKSAIFVDSDSEPDAGGKGAVVVAEKSRVVAPRIKTPRMMTGSQAFVLGLKRAAAPSNIENDPKVSPPELSWFIFLIPV